MLVEIVVAHILQKIAPDLEKSAVNFLKEPALKALGLDKWSATLRKANHLFVELFSKELSLHGAIRTALVPEYESSLAAFCGTDAVQSVLKDPFDSETPLNVERLRILWDEIRDASGEPLIHLPAGFGWKQIASPYREGVLAIVRESPELRQAMDSVHLRQTAESAQRLAGPALSFDETGYRTALRERYGLLRLGDIDGDWSLYHLRLQSIYVPQTAKRALPPREITRDYWERLQREGDNELVRRTARPGQENLDWQRQMEEYRERRPRPISEIVEEPANQRLVVLGDPGLGKSTLLQSLSLRWADDPHRQLPLLIELRQYVNAGLSQRNFLNFLESGAGAIWRFPRLVLDSRLRAETMLVMFDGLDEIVDRKERSKVVDEIVLFAREYPRARVIVTSRIIGYHPGSAHPETLRNAGFEHFTLQDFEPDEMEQFNQRWHDAAFAGKPEERRKYADRLRDALTSSATIRELAGSPLLLTFMALLSRTQPLPRNRRLLYDKTAELLLRKWEAPKFGDAEDRIGVDEKKRLLQAVAFDIQEGRSGIGVNQIDLDRMRTIFRDYLKNGLGLSEHALVADDLIEKLHARNHMLCFLGDRQYGFVHRTFLEYFCALALQERLERTRQLQLEDLLRRVREVWKHDVWHEVIKLLSSLLDAGQAGKIIEELLDQKGENEGWRAVLLAADCLEEVQERGRVRGLDSRLQAEVVALTRFEMLFTPYSFEAEYATRIRSVAYEHWARLWRIPVVRAALLQRAQSENWEARMCALRELSRGWHDDPEVLALLKSAAEQDRNALVRSTALAALAHGWRNEPEVLKLLKDRAHDIENEDVRATALSELARGWRDDPEVLPLLKESIRDRGDDIVRRRALIELARGWRYDPEVLPLLKECARNDSYASVRSAALKELVLGWKGDPELMPLLLDKARNDEDVMVRRTALSELAQGWREQPEIFPLLMERAGTRVDKFVRSAALSELSRGWHDHPEVLLLLLDRARWDDDDFVRCTALCELARGWRQEPDVRRLLQERATDDEHDDVRSTALSELARGWREDPLVLELLKDRAKKDPRTVIRGTVLGELVRGWRNDSEVLALLKDRILNDSHNDVRRMALSELAKGWHLDPDVLPLLKDRATNDLSSLVRRTALGELTRGWRDDRGVTALLKDRARNDQHDDVRSKALRDLARGWSADPEVLPLLLERAREDEDAVVRSRAVDELARRWASDLRVKALLDEVRSSIETWELSGN